MKVLALDFDGVISDSAPEAFEVALRTFDELRPEANVMGRDRSALYAGFLELMPLGNRAEDYAVEIEALCAGVPIPDQDRYDRFRATLPADLLDRFHKRFYERRAELLARDPGRWYALLAPYPDFVDLLRRRAGERTLAIATAKDRASVRHLLDRYGVSDLFPDPLLLDKEVGVSKRAHLTALREHLGVGFDAITFVDDKVNHLDSVASLGVRCALAAWGYNGPRERARARAQGYLVCDLGSAEAILFA